MKKSGFSLMELLIVLAVLSILLAIALPSYRHYMIITYRSAAKAFLLEVASRQDVYIGQIGSYADSLEKLNVTVPPDVVTAGYAIAISVETITVKTGTPPEPDVTMPGYKVSATPAPGSRQEGDGALYINQFGFKSPVGKW